MKGVLVSAANSGAGKTVITLAIMRILKDMGVDISPAKAGPDFIDPAYHHAATGVESYNLDCWAMRKGLVKNLAYNLTKGQKRLVVEGMMGLFDGAVDGTGSSAEVAKFLGLPILFVVDATNQSHSVAALVKGFANFMPGVRLAGIILNKVGSPRHESMLRQALQPVGVPIVGVVYRNADLALPSRHLGLVQASENTDINRFITNAAKIIRESVDIAQIIELCKTGENPLDVETIAKISPLGQRIAVSRDNAFRFAYPHLIDGWRKSGADISFFSPLADETPDKNADSIYLCGGYPELFAEQLAAARNFKTSIMAMAQKGIRIYGECGGYMTLGQTIEDVNGNQHPMLGLLPLKTSFKQKKLHLGYRRLKAVNNFFPIKAMRGHEFHYAAIIEERGADPLFKASDSVGLPLGNKGLRVNNVAGSFMHLIDLED